MGSTSSRDLDRRIIKRKMNVESEPILISNKMVERMVDDTITYKSLNDNPSNDYHDKIFIEKMNCLDINHSERHGMSTEALDTLIRKIEKMIEVCPTTAEICEKSKQKLIDCYKEKDDVLDCSQEISVFRKSVANHTFQKLRITRLIDEQPINSIQPDVVNIDKTNRSLCENNPLRNENEKQSK